MSWLRVQVMHEAAGEQDRAMEWWLLAANQGDLELQWRLVTSSVPLLCNVLDRLQGLAFWEGSSGVLKDGQQAAKWFSEAAQAGHPSAQWMLGKCYAQGEGVQQNWEEAARWRRRAMTQVLRSQRH